MATLINDPILESRLRAERELSGADRFDEVWEGTYMMSPLADNEHQKIQSKLTTIFLTILGLENSGVVLAGVNVSDREDDWTHNYRCPDVAIYLPENPARDCQTHWCGGPDLAVEILSPYDRSRDKIPFYARVGTRELWLIDRNPWSIEIFRLEGTSLISTGRIAPGEETTLTSAVLPLTFRFVPGKDRPGIQLARTDSAERWDI